MLVAGLSLVLCVGLVVVWVWSYRAAVGVGLLVEGEDASSTVVVGASRGEALYVRTRAIGPRRRVMKPSWAGPSGWGTLREKPGELISRRDTLWQRMGFYSETYANTAGWHRVRRHVFPLWLPTALAAVTPAAWLVRAHRRARRRRAGGFCTRCGYDLTGNVSGTCPECGTAVAA